MSEKVKCEECNKEFHKKGIKGHIWRVHTEEGRNHYLKLRENHKSWNRGLTKETDERIKQIAKTYSDNLKSGKTIHWNIGQKLSEEHKQKISKGMKIAHEENRAWNIGQSRWNNEQSYPEKFFEKVINNEFEDKNYKTEYSLGRYSLDFAWEEKKKCIEIDGSQHQRFQEVIERDQRKDLLIGEKGWEVLRIKWTDMFHETKKYIKIAKDFIDN